MTPDVVVAEPTWAQEKPVKFWEKYCCHLGSSGLQFIGLDGDCWAIPDIHTWVKSIRDLLGSKVPKRLFLTSIVIMAWPEDARRMKFESVERFREVVLAGANLRMKREEYYQRDGADFHECFYRDLHEAGLLLPPDKRPAPEPRPEPQFDTKEEEENYRQRLAFYADPPFKWHPNDLAVLFGGGSSNS